MSEIKKLFTQSSHYFIGHAFVMVAGLISFPILTRIFSVGDYGILGLVSTTLFIIQAFAKLGFPSSIIRFYAESKSTNRLANFYSTMFLSPVFFAAIIGILFWSVIQLLPSSLLNPNILGLLWFVSILIFTGCASDILVSFFRAEQRTALYNSISIMRRYGSLILSIFFVYFFVEGLPGFYFGQAVSWSVTFFILLYMFLRRQKISLTDFSAKLLKKSIRFGFPLTWSEMGHLVLNYADRYMIQFYLGSTSLGLYTAGYNLATCVTEVLIYPINYAMTPIYMNILVNKGKEEVKEFLTKLFRYYLLIAIPLVFGFIAIGKDLILFLASSKYIEASTILSYVVVGQLIYSCQIILNVGLFIREKTYIVMFIKMGACVVNVALNLLLIPRYGIVGAAQATLISYIFYTSVITYYSMREFSFPLEYRRIILYLAASGFMFIATKNINLTSCVVNLLAKVTVGTLVYSFSVLALDSQLRQKSIQIAKDLCRGGEARL